jgi:hypothetical protein
MELWQSIKRDYIGELQKTPTGILRDLYEVKFQHRGSVKAYEMRIQEIIDPYQTGAEEPSERDHVLFPLELYTSNGRVRSGVSSDHGSTMDQLKIMGQDAKAVIKRPCDREGAIKHAKGLSGDVSAHPTPVVVAPDRPLTTAGRCRIQSPKMSDLVHQQKKAGYRASPDVSAPFPQGCDPCKCACLCQESNQGPCAH